MPEKCQEIGGEPGDDGGFGFGETEDEVQTVVRAVDDEVGAEEGGFMGDHGPGEGESRGAAAEPAAAEEPKGAGLMQGGHEGAEAVGAQAGDAADFAGDAGDGPAGGNVVGGVGLGEDGIALGMCQGGREGALMLEG